MFFSLAWKNLWRNRTRSLIIMTAIALGLSGGLISSAVNFGMADQMIKSAILTQTSHIQIHHPEFAKDRDINFTIPDALTLSGKIKRIRNVLAGVRSGNGNV